VRQPLDGVRLKLSRADHHLAALEKSIRGFLDSEFYELVAEMDDHQIIYRVDRVDDTRAEWGVLIGEVIYSLRSALDHLAYELAVLRHGRPLPPELEKSSAFPIKRTGPEFRRRIKRGSRRGQSTTDSGWHKVRGMPRRAQTAIERLQPYHRRKDPDLLPFLWLEDLCNVDKHRTLHLTSAHLAASQYRLSGGFQEIHKIEVFRRAFKPNALVSRISGKWLPDTEMRVDIHVVPDITFENRTGERSIRGRSVLDTLYGCRNAVLSKAIPRLMPFFPPDNQLVIQRREEPRDEA
jgi:hypothetical protein